MSMELFNMLAGMMPKEVLVEMLDDSVQKFKVDPSNENFEELAAKCVLVSMRKMQDQSGNGDPVKGIEALNEQIKDAKASTKLYEKVKGKTN